MLVVTKDLISEAAAQRVRVVTGTCDTVGVAGGYTAGGGHGSFTSIYGMAADSVLEWEVVTADDDHLIATPKRNVDLYWALSGGGAGTFAVVVSMTTRTYPDGLMQGATLALTVNDPALNGSLKSFWAAVEAFHSSLTPLVNAGGVMTWVLTDSVLQGIAAVLDGDDSGILNAALDPIVTAVENRTSVVITVSSTSHDSWWDLYQAYFLPVLSTSPNGQISGGRLLPRDVLLDPEAMVNVAQALQVGAENGFVWACGAINANNTGTVPENAVFPVWWSTLVQCIAIRTWDYNLALETNREFQENLTTTLMPAIESATPGGGSYLNEANFEQPGWQQVFYGNNYPRLRAIKEKYEPDGLFYARTAVGSEDWAENFEHRLCKTGYTQYS